MKDSFGFDVENIDDADCFEKTDWPFPAFFPPEEKCPECS